jgi:Helix-turn-helix domain
MTVNNEPNGQLTPEQKRADEKSLVNQNKRYAQGFVMIPNWIMVQVHISRDAKLLYGLLQYHAWQSDHCFPGYAILMREMQCSRDALAKYIRELKESGLIEVERRGLGLSNIYKIVDWTQEDFETHLKQKSENRTSGSPEKRTSVVRKSDANKKESKKTQIEKDRNISNRQSTREIRSGTEGNKIFREAHASNTEKGGEGTKAPSCSQRAPAATGKQNRQETNNTQRASGASPTQTQTPTQKPAAITGSPKQQPPVYIGKPLTQEEIDEKKKHGQNASGFTPLAGIIPASHWQELEVRFSPSTNGNSNGKGNGNLHYHHTTKNAPASIDATMEQLTKILNDEPANTAQNINRAAKLCREAGYQPEQFTSVLWSVYHERVRPLPDKAVKTRRSDGRPNKMLLFFTELEKALGRKEPPNR